MLAEAGVTLLGENRAQDLAAKAEAHPGVVPLALHRPAPEPQGQADRSRTCELIHSVASDSALRPARAARHAGDARCSSRSTSRARRRKAGIAPAELGAFIERCPVPVAGLMTMPPFTEDPEASRPHFAALRELAREHGLHRPLDGHLAGLRGRRRGGRDDRAGRLDLYA